ncbi:50S ribosomal protein L33 [Halalkalibacter oceani]|uniref:50S ribosomal protein L33 n=1 Tax=Halalkalibacter oceani TaxID=1653776 RepID=UPI003D9C918A
MPLFLISPVLGHLTPSFPCDRVKECVYLKMRWRCKMRSKVVLACEVCHSRNYSTEKNKQSSPARIEVKKFCKSCQEHTLHRETK